MAQNNRITLIGNLGRDPEVRTDSQGKEFVYLTLCTTDSYKDHTGQWIEKTPQWHTVFIFSPQVQERANYFTKGQRLEINGSLTYRPAAPDANGYERFDATITAHRIEMAPLTKKTTPVEAMT